MNGLIDYGYEILPDMTDQNTFKENGDLVTLSAGFTAGNGIRIQLLDMGSDDPDWRVFDFTEDQAKILGSALLRWAEAHGAGRLE